jgi:hypothetical protein
MRASGSRRRSEVRHGRCKTDNIRRFRFRVADKPNGPGAICSIALSSDRFSDFSPPELVRFRRCSNLHQSSSPPDATAVPPRYREQPRAKAAPTSELTTIFVPNAAGEVHEIKLPSSKRAAPAGLRGRHVRRSARGLRLQRRQRRGRGCIQGASVRAD